MCFHPGWTSGEETLALRHLSFPILVLKIEKQYTGRLRELGIDNIKCPRDLVDVEVTPFDFTCINMPLLLNHLSKTV